MQVTSVEFSSTSSSPSSRRLVYEATVGFLIPTILILSVLIPKKAAIV